MSIILIKIENNRVKRVICLKIIIIAIFSFIPNQLSACTIFIINNSDKTFICANEDWKNVPTAYWTIPTDINKYGIFCIGFYGDGEYWSQFLVNEYRLACDWAALPHKQIINEEGLPEFPDKIGTFLLQKCKTVEEAIVCLIGFDGVIAAMVYNRRRQQIST